jgi:hypothetical protein
MMLASTHTLVPMLMQGNALVLKTPVENALRTGICSIEKHLSWFSDIPPAVLFPLHRLRPAEYQPNQQPATVFAERGAGEARRRVGRRRGRLTSGVRQSLRVLVMQSSTPAPGAQSPWDSTMGYRGQHLTVPISTIKLLKTRMQMTVSHPEHAHAYDRFATVTLQTRPAHTTIGWRQDRRPVVSKRPPHICAATKMSPHISIGPEPVLATHARSPTAAVSHSPAGEDSAPHLEQNFYLSSSTFAPLLHSTIFLQRVC